MTSPFEDPDALMPFKLVYYFSDAERWFDSTTDVMYRQLKEGMVYKISVTSHSSHSPTLHLSTDTASSTRIQSVNIPAGVENLWVKEVVVQSRRNRYLSMIGSGTLGEEITIELIPMMITPP